MRMLTAVTILVGASAAFFAQPAFSQTRCPDMRTASGACVNGLLARSMRQTVLVMTQPKFSHTAPPWLPYQDRENFIAGDHHEISNFFTFPAPGFTQIKP